MSKTNLYLLQREGGGGRIGRAGDREGEREGVTTLVNLCLNMKVDVCVYLEE